MGRFKFRIGTKLGLAAGIGIVLVGGILANQMIGSRSIAESNRLVIINYLNKGNAQASQTAMARAQLAAVEIGSALSVGEVDKSFEILRTHATEAGTEIDAATERATRKVTQDAYREAKKFMDAYLASAVELAAAQRAVIGAPAGAAKAAAEAAKASILTERMRPAAREVSKRIDDLVSVANEFAARCLRLARSAATPSRTVAESMKLPVDRPELIKAPSRANWSTPDRCSSAIS